MKLVLIKQGEKKKKTFYFRIIFFVLAENSVEKQNQTTKIRKRLCLGKYCLICGVRFFRRIDKNLYVWTGCEELNND